MSRLRAQRRSAFSLGTTPWQTTSCRPAVEPKGIVHECRGRIPAVHRCHRCTICCDIRRLTNCRGVNLVSKSADPLHGGPRVRILPPSSRESVLSQEPIFVGQETPAFRAGVPGCVSRCGRQRAAGAANIAPTRQQYLWSGHIPVPHFWRCRVATSYRVKVARPVPNPGRASSRLRDAGGSCELGSGSSKAEARSADRASVAAGRECASSFLRPSDRAAGAHRESLG